MNIELHEMEDGCPFYDGSKPLMGRFGEWEILIAATGITLGHKADTPQENYYIWDTEGRESLRFLTPEMGRLVVEAIFAHGEPSPEWLQQLGFFRG